MRAILLLLACLACTFARAQAPLVQWLVATPSTVKAGGSSTLRWRVDGATSVAIDHGIGPVAAKGSIVISPSATTTYTLTASNGGSSAQKSQTVVVSANAAASGGRYVNMVSPVGGQRFTAPASIRAFAAAFDPTGVNCGAGGLDDRCASRVDFYLDDTLMSQVQGSQSEYWVFKTSFGGVGPGAHRVWARAIYTNPPQQLDSESMWIQVDPQPVYAQTVNLAQDMILSGSQALNLVGTPSGRIRVNGNGYRISSAAGWNGQLTLKYVDLVGLGAPNDTTPGMDISTAKAVVIEDSIFESTGAVYLDLSGTATASVRRNEFRSNMLMPEQQQPEFGSDASYPAFQASGASTGAKFFQGNRVGVGWADFRNADNWLIGGEGAEGNVVIAPRGGIWARNMTRSIIRGNLVYHVYYGGWSQGNVMELDGSDDILVEHNIVGGGSWPIRGFGGGTLRYNLLLDAGHQWLWVTGDNAAVHHNIFAGGDAEVAGIYVIYAPQNVSIHNNTIEGSMSPQILPMWVDVGATVSFHSNAVVDSANAPAIQVDGTLSADYNLFSGQSGPGARNYSDNRKPLHDVGPLNAQVDAHLAEPPEPLRYSWDDLWSGRVGVRQVLANYRARYTPAAGSPLIDAGNPAGVAGNDIGAVGAGQAASDDLFGVEAIPDLSIAQSASPNPAGAGRDIVYTLSITSGRAGAYTALVTDVLPTGTSFLFASPGCTYSAGTVSCTASQPLGMPLTISVAVRANAAGIVTNNASVTSPQGNASLNASTTLDVTVNAAAGAAPIPRYRLYSDVTKEHHFTTDLNEYNVLGSYVGTWVQEGTVGKVLNGPGSYNGVGAVPYYRLYNPGPRFHHWTTDANEYYTLGLLGWNQEGIDGYILPAPAAGTMQLYRLLYPAIANLHHWTVDPNEYNTLIGTYGWVGEPGAGYVIQ